MASDYLLTTQLTPDSTQPAAIVWDCDTGNIISQFKNNGPIATNCLAIASGSHVVATEKTKPLLHVWSMHGSYENKKLIVPSVPNALCLSSDNDVLAMGIGMQVYVWTLKSGALMSVTQKHYQAVTCVRIYEDFLLAGGQDGFLVVYNLTDLLNVNESDVSARYVKNDHALAITDIFINNFGVLKSRFVTTSRDQSARIYELTTGNMLLTVLCPEPITAVVGNLQFSTLYLGASNGEIFSVSLKNPPRSLEIHIEPMHSNLFTGGHKKAITCLSINVAVQNLASAAADNVAIIWNILSRQILRKIEHKFAVTNVRYLPFSNKSEIDSSTFIIKQLARSAETNPYKHAFSIMRTRNSTYEDEQESRQAHLVSTLQTELDQANTLNNKMYERILELIKKKTAKGAQIF